MREMNRNNSVEPQKFKEYKDFSGEVPTNDEIVVLAIPKSFGIQCYEISVNNFGIGFETYETDKYIIYYDYGSSDTFRYVYKFEEV